MDTKEEPNVNPGDLLHVLNSGSQERLLAHARRYRTNAYLRENMPYDAAADTYTCPADKPLSHHICDTKRCSRTGYEATLTVYECFSCQGYVQKMQRKPVVRCTLSAPRNAKDKGICVDASTGRRAVVVPST